MLFKILTLQVASPPFLTPDNISRLPFAVCRFDSMAGHKSFT